MEVRGLCFRDEFEDKFIELYKTCKRMCRAKKKHAELLKDTKQYAKDLEYEQIQMN